MTGSGLCEQLLRRYLALEEKPPRYERPSGLVTYKRSIYITDPIWAAAQALKVHERRSISAILEQLLRAHLGLVAPCP